MTAGPLTTGAATSTVRTADDERVRQALQGCADEPIRLPGSVQPHGVLLALQGPSMQVVCASANADELFGRPASELLGRTPAQLLPPGEAETLQDAAAGGASDRPRTLTVPGHAGVRMVDLLVHPVAHAGDALVVVELEPRSDPDEDDSPWWQHLGATLQQLQAARSLHRLVEVLADEMRALTGFDRVMVYRFDSDWNGEVVAEARQSSLEPFLGLRYPASDIPAQARELYRTNWLRLIPDASYTPVPLVPERIAGEPLDLGRAVLRSVSPAHVEYLRAMGVVASMSVSLLVEGRLWGLIACHAYSGPHRPDARVRAAAEFLGRTASVLLGSLREEGDTRRVLATAAAQTALTGALAANPRNPIEALTGDPGVLDLVPAGGAAVRIGGRLRLVAETPPAELVDAICSAVWPAAERATVATASLSALPDAPEVDWRVASGLLAVPLPGGDGRDCLLWFRPEVLRDVTWGGDPYATRVVEDSAGVRLGPRSSFDRWTEIVRRTAEPWQAHEVQAAERLVQHVAETVLQRATEENRLIAALQRTVLGEALPQPPGLCVAARYVPSARDVVGGDWYDLVPLPDGRVAVVIGDVAGHGMGVAALSAQLRLGLRALLQNAVSPGQALQRLNELVAWQLPGELATAVVVVLDPTTGRARMSSAGHLPPARLSATASLFEPARGPALGLVERGVYSDTEIDLAPGEGLLLYTDGLVERRGEDVDERMAEMVRCASGGGDAEAVCTRLLAAMPASDDDVTMLAITRSPDTQC